MARGLSRRMLLTLSIGIAAAVGAGCTQKGDSTTINNVARDPQGIALFANVTYVDYIPGDSDSEASNVEAFLTASGFDVKNFTDFSAAGISKAVKGRKILVFPEMETADLSPDLTPEAAQVIADFVSQGGTVIFFDPYDTALVNNIFGFSIDISEAIEPITLDASAAAGSPFAGGPATIPANDATDSVNSLPSWARALYVDDDGEATVALIPYGLGNVVLLGWDWYDALPVGTQDGGWLDVLISATRL
jgi:hypothetical protein